LLYSKAIRGGRANKALSFSSCVKSAGEMLSCRSPQGSSVTNPAE
jgi:hypothetical protein